MTLAVSEIQDSDFREEVLNAEKVVLVDFWASWCGPCKVLGTVLEKIAINYADKVKFCRMDVSKNNEVPARYGVRNIPHIIILKSGKIVSQFVGLKPAEEITSLLDEILQ